MAQGEFISLEAERAALQDRLQRCSAWARQASKKDEANASVGRYTSLSRYSYDEVYEAWDALVDWDKAHPGFADALILAGRQGITVPHEREQRGPSIVFMSQR